MLQTLITITLEVSNNAWNLFVVSRTDRKLLVGSSKSFKREDGPRKTEPLGLLSPRDVVWQTAKASGLSASNKLSYSCRVKIHLITNEKYRNRKIKAFIRTVFASLVFAVNTLGPRNTSASRECYYH